MMAFPHDARDLENSVMIGTVPFSVHKLSGFIDVITDIDFVNPADPILSLEYLDPQGSNCANATLPLSTYTAFLVQNFRIEPGNAKLPTGTTMVSSSINGRLLPRNGYVAATSHYYGDGSGYWNDKKTCTCGADTAFKGQDNLAEMHSHWCDLYKVPKHNNRVCDCGAIEKNPEIHPDYIAHKLSCPAHKDTHVDS